MVIIVLVDDWLSVTVVLGDDRLFVTVVLGDDKDDPMTRRRGRRPHGGGRWPHHYPGWNADGGRTEGGPHGSLHASSLHTSAASVEGRVHEQTPAGAEEWFWGPRDAPPSAANHRNQLHMGQMYREGVAGFHMTETRQFNGWSCMAGRGGAESMGRHGLLHADFRAADPIGIAWELGPSGELPVTLPFTHGQQQGPFPLAAMHQYGLHGPLSQQQPPGYQCSRREDCGPPAYEPLWYGSPHHGPSHGMPPPEGFFQPGSSCPQPPLSQSHHFERLGPDDCHQRPLSPLSYKDMLMGRLRAVQGLLQAIECQRDPDWSGEPRDWGAWRGGQHVQADCGPDRPPRATGGPPQHRGGRCVNRRHRSPSAPAGFPPPLTDVVTDRHPAPSTPRSGSQGPASGWQCDPGAGGNRPLSASQAPRVLSGGREGRIPTRRTDSRAMGARGSRAGADRGGSKAAGGRADSSGVQSRDSAASPALRGPSGKAGRAGEGRSAHKSLSPVSPASGPWEQDSADKARSRTAAASSSTRPGVDSAATASSSETAKQKLTPASPSSIPRPKCSNVLLRTLLSPSVGQTDRTDQRAVAPTEAPAVSQAMTVAELMGEIVDAFARPEPRAERLPVASCATEPTGERQGQDGTCQGSPTSSAPHNPQRSPHNPQRSPHNPPGSPQRSELKSAPKEVISDCTQRDAETHVFPKLEHDTDVMTLSYANMGGQGANSLEGRQTSDCTKDAAGCANTRTLQAVRTEVVEVQPVVSSCSFLHCGPAGASPSNVNPSGAGAAGGHSGSRLKDDVEDACFSNSNSQGSQLGLEDLGDICHTCLACRRRFASSTLLEDHLLEHMQFHMDDCLAPEDEEESFAQYDENMGREHPSHLKLEYLVDSERQGTSREEVHKCAPSELSSACELSNASELPNASELSSGPSKTSCPSPRKTSIPTPNSHCDVHKQSPDRSKTTDPELGRVTPGDPSSNKQDSSPSRAVCSGPNKRKSSHPTTSRSGHHKQSPSRAQTAHPKPPRQTSSSSGAARTDFNRQTSRGSKASESYSNKQTPNHSKSPQSRPCKQTPNHSKSSQSRPSKRTPNHSKSLHSGPDKQASNHSKSLHSAPDKQTPNHSKSLHSGPVKQIQNHSKSLHSGPDKQTPDHSKSSPSRPNRQTPNHSTSSHSSPDKETPNHSKSSHSGPDKETSNRSKSSHTPPDKQKFNNSKSSHACPDKQKKCKSSKSSRCEDVKQASGSDGAESAKRWKILSSGQVFKMRKSPTSSDPCRYHKQCATEEVRNADFDESNSSELPDCPQASQPPASGPMTGGINPDMPQSAQDPESGPMSGRIKNSTSVEWFPTVPKSSESRGLKRLHSGPEAPETVDALPVKVRKLTGLVADAQSGKKRHVSADDADCAKVKDRGARETVVYRNRLRYVRDLCRPLSVVLERVSAEETKPPATRGEGGLLRQLGSGTRGPPTTRCSASEPRGNTESDHELQHSANPAFISKEQTFVCAKESAPSQGNPASESEECCGGSGPEDFCDRAAASSSDKSSESTDNDTGFIFCTQCFSVFTNRQVFEAHACYLRRHDEETETDEDDEEPEEDSGRDCAHGEANEEALDDNNDDELTDGDNPWHSLKIGSRFNRQSRGSRKRKPAKEASIETHKAPTPSAPKKGGRVKGRRKKTVTSPSRDDHMFTCSRCDQKFFSRAGLLFHWQHLHKKLPASTRLSS